MTLQAAGPGVRHVLFEARSPRAAKSYLDAHFAPIETVVAANLTGYRVELSGLVAEGIRVERLVLPTELRARADHGLGDSVHVVRLLEGRLRVRTAAGDFELARDDHLLLPPRAPFRVRAEGLSLGLVRLDPDLVASLAPPGSDGSPGRIRYTAARPTGPAAARHWGAAVHHASRDVLARPEIAQQAWLLRQTVRHLAMTLLHAFPTGAVVEVPTPDVVSAATPRAVRQALRYIEANAHRPVGLSDIVAAAQSNARTLQQGFARYVGASPLAYLRRIRLRHAHEELLAADPAAGDTVGVIAARWGFPKPGSFAAHYRSAYGVKPSRTLRGRPDRA